MLGGSKKVNILFLTANIPYPLDDGIKIRAFHTIKQLVKKNYKITLLCFIDKNETENIEKLKSEVDIDVVGIPIKADDHSHISRVYYTLFSRFPVYMIYYYKQIFKKKVDELVKNSDFDLIYIYDRSMALYGKDIKLPKIMDSVDSQSLNSLSGFKSSKNFLHKTYWYLNYIKAKIAEKEIYPLYDYVITAAERDTEQLQILADKILTIPNGIDLTYFKPLNLDKIPNSLVFVGAMDAFSNQQAVLFFINEIFPKIKQRIPIVKLYIVGKNPPQNILNLDDNHSIYVTGYVDDIRKYIDQCDVIISPLKMASGIQNKILVAMAMNKPVVSTNIGMGDINGFINKNDIIVTKNDDEFADSVIELLSNRYLLEDTGKNGRTIVGKNYSWESMGMKLNSVIENVIGYSK